MNKADHLKVLLKTRNQSPDSQDEQKNEREIIVENISAENTQSERSLTGNKLSATADDSDDNQQNFRYPNHNKTKLLSDMISSPINQKLKVSDSISPVKLESPKEENGSVSQTKFDEQRPEQGGRRFF